MGFTLAEQSRPITAVRVNNPVQLPLCSNQPHLVSPRALLNLQNLKQVARHLHSIRVLLPEPSEEAEEEVEEEKEEAEKGCEGSGAGQPDLLGADNVAELGLDLQEMPLELQTIALCGERQGFTSPYTPPSPGTTSRGHPHPAPTLCGPSPP